MYSDLDDRIETVKIHWFRSKERRESVMKSIEIRRQEIKELEKKRKEIEAKKNEIVSVELEEGANKPIQPTSEAAAD